MSDLQSFREKVTIYRKRQHNPNSGKPSTPEELAKAIGLSADELGHRLRDTGRSPLTHANVLTIVNTLAAWETLTWQEAVQLLTLMDYPLDPLTNGNMRLIERLMEQVEYVLLANPTVSVVTKEVVETARENLIIGPN